MKSKSVSRIKRHRRVRKIIQGTAARPRLAVFRSARHIYVQAIDDGAGRTLAAASSLTKDLPPVEDALTAKQKTAKAVGRLIAQKLLERGITRAVFDRGGFLYHGRVARLAEGAREAGLQI
ncbi:MAG TPA: 50S ribosomal protein L18 [bacterium]|nr:50S ribosomal protein L18 [Candidatus Omnitrophota bacterium]HOJ60526.1 50S ribosomal protein L18 [bacterium]HOL96240.1 50S ribosomal protein L18 [bacterium]HPP02491.1 50S ribosomal protein L18 [bacterium]HXK92665.1 50S ribosomal protein L18 [bacterium]